MQSFITASSALPNKRADKPFVPTQGGGMEIVDYYEKISDRNTCAR